jgi:hypothetical protein
LAQNAVRRAQAEGRISADQAAAERAGIAMQAKQEEILTQQEEILAEQRRANEELRRLRMERDARIQGGSFGR